MPDEPEPVRKALHELDRSLKSLSGDPGPKAVHKLRTAARRVEAVVAALAPADRKKSRRLVRSIEPLRKAAGSVRDMDVLIANARKLARHSAGGSLTRLIDLLQSARQQYAAELLRLLKRRQKTTQHYLREYSKLVASSLTPSSLYASTNGRPHQPHESMHAPAMDVVHELSEWPPLDAGNIHAFRLKVKQLRYILQLDREADQRLVEALGQVQHRVGDWHDWQQLAEIAREILHPEHNEALLARIDQTAKRRFDHALAAANTLRGRYLAAPLSVGV